MDVKRGLVNLENKKGQVWVETVIYTLIAFTMIALVLAYAKPKIEEFQDKALIEQSIKMMQDIDSKILSAGQGTAGNIRLIPELKISKGSLFIDGIEDQIIFTMDSRYTFSEPGRNTTYGSIIVKTEKRGDFNEVSLKINYGEVYNLTLQGEDTTKTLSGAATPYSLSFSNKKIIGDKTEIDVEVN